MIASPAELQSKADTLACTWQAYRATPGFEQFVEFAVTLNSFSEFLIDKAIPGLHHVGRELEQQALSSFGDDSAHPLPAEVQDELNQSMRHFLQLVHDSLSSVREPSQERRGLNANEGETRPARPVWLLSAQVQAWQELQNQLGYFGLQTSEISWQALPEAADQVPIILLDVRNCPDGAWAERIGQLRQRYPVSQILGLELPSDFAVLQLALKKGCDYCVPAGTTVASIVAQLLELNSPQEQDSFRVLIVDDSTTATRLIERALQEQDIRTHTIHRPQQVLEALREFAPDLILLDMYMPDCTGVEAARVIRQHNQFLSIPIVYLSGETDVALQIEALRLGGDHFLTKPFNPVFLNAVVKSKIERYRALRRSMYHDSLTGLLNHTSTKTALDASLTLARRNQLALSVAMVDIDRFKLVNDTYGHPMGDQIIRSLAWLLKQRLRRGDVIGRYGGEEFLVGLVGADTRQAAQVMDRIRADFARIQHPYSGGHFNVSFSCGLASYPATTDIDRLVKSADAALYEAKHAGRNRVIAVAD